MYTLIILLIFSIILVLDLLHKINITRKGYSLPVLLILSHYYLLLKLYFYQLTITPPFLPLPVFHLIHFLLFGFIFAYVGIRLHLFPVQRIQDSGLRAGILYGGRKLLLLSVGAMVLQGILYLVCFIYDIPFLESAPTVFTPYILIIDAILTIIYLWLLFINGLFRILFTCYRLGVAKRIIIFFALWIPLVNLYLLYYLCKKAKEEYMLEICRFENSKDRNGKLFCATKYPIVLLHGIGFRDLNFFNYWGRIPKQLAKNGAVVYYGHQEAWGLIEDNASFIKTKIEEILKEYQCEKVNVIAHSKGGLDARYLISELKMDNKIASLTTISTPHHGSELIRLLNKLPDKLYRNISGAIDKVFKKAGDKHPDCYHSSKQLSPEFCETFNRQNPDSPKVYYQSYASVTRHILGDSLLSIPHLLMKLEGAGQNDGLVTVDSAKWGKFQTIFTSSSRRGISHGDMIDLKREDYNGFDVIESYVNIVHLLKEKDF